MDVPAAVVLPALNLSAGVEVLNNVLLVLTLCDTVRSPLRVSTATVPVELIPL